MVLGEERMAVHAELDPPVVVLTLDRPKANAFDSQQIDALIDALGRAREVKAARALVLRATGDVAFSAGADLSSVGALATPDGLAAWTKRAGTMLDAIESLPIPVVAAIRKPAAGGGLEVALACHFRVMSHDSHLSIPEIHRGYLPSWRAVERLVSVTGPAFTTDLLVTGRRVGADEALARGLAHRVAMDAEAMAHALALEIAKLPPLAVRAALEQVRGVARGDPTEEIRRRELADLERLVRTEDTLEGIGAFFEKREPRFRGC